MNRTSIEWVKNLDGSQGYTINPVKGLCPMACSYCYARRMYKRFKWNPRIRYEAWGDSLVSIREPSRIFIGSTMELFGDWIYLEWLKAIFAIVRNNPCHTFIFLTKQPQNLIKWSPFPENCWVGVTCTNQTMVLEATNHLYNHRIAKTQFLSIEPLLSWDTSHFSHPLTDSISKLDINWLIIGQQTPVSAKTQPEISWIREIVEAADKAGIPVFLKDNLVPLIAGKGTPEGLFYKDCRLRQEMPK